MFLSAARESDLLYDFESEENTLKWKNILVSALQKVQYQVHPTLTAKEDALSYVESLILRLLGMLCASQPHGVQDVEERVQKTFPHPIDKWAIAEAQAAVEKGKKKASSPSLVLPVDKIHQLLQKELLGYKVDLQVTQYIVAVLEYIAADILKLAGNYIKNICHTKITCQDIKVAMCADKVLMDMFYEDEEVTLTMEEEPCRRTSVTYDEVVKDLIHEDRQYIRDLNMIIQVFREPFAKHLKNSKELDLLFSNIFEVFDFSNSLLASFEDALEMAEENCSPAIGACFEEMAENAEFDVYEKYAHDISNAKCHEALMSHLQNPEVASVLHTAGHGFFLAFKYVLPKLLLAPIYHCFHYFDCLKLLKNLTKSEEDRESLEQAEGLLQPLKMSLEKITGSSMSKRKSGEVFLRFHQRISRQAATQKITELKKMIDGWEGKDAWKFCNEFIMEGHLGKVASGTRRHSERIVFLFDGVMLLCKSNKRSSVVGPTAEYRLKEEFCLCNIEIIDKEDTEELKHSFEIAPRSHPHVHLFAKSAEEKNLWMANLIMLNTKSTLERILDALLLDAQNKHPLRLPSPEIYRFAVEDSESNILFEEVKTLTPTVPPLIKGATLIKLVERLTYHLYADPTFLRTFLTTFRSFCQPQEFLDLLIERFDIPEPPSPDFDAFDGPELENLKNIYREDLKRFRKEYSQPVQFRVLNALRHWVDQHYYDFERDDSLLENLTRFLETVRRSKNMRKWVDSIYKVIKRKKDSHDEFREIIFSYEKNPPPIEMYLNVPPEKYDLLTLHPIEIARQLTLLEFDLYRAVKPSELVGSVWTKKDKHKRSPNLLKMIHHSSNFTFWLMKCIVETENFEERVAVVSRILEVMIVLQELNNFTGVVEIVGAMNSACVHRLEHTFAAIRGNLKKALDEAQLLNSDHFKKYQERLRSINPPCVPFFGMYLTNILHTEEGNPDFLPNSEGLINFSKRRKVAEITGEIQQYQNQPYCLKLHQEIRHFLETLDPLEDRSEKEFNDYLYSKSLEIEPRGSRQPPKFPRHWPDLPLKSPGIKPRQSRHPEKGDMRTFSTSSQFINHDEDDGHNQFTPPTPSTPLTPPHYLNSDNSDNSVFATVLINPSGNSFSSSIPSSFSSLPPPTPGPPILAPPPRAPPRPPRRKIDSGELSPRTRVPSNDDDSPPPLPPRSGTLPRSTSHIPPRSPTALPRRNSAMDLCLGQPLIAPPSSTSTVSMAPPLTPPSTMAPPHLPSTTMPPPPLAPPPVARRLSQNSCLLPVIAHPETPQLPPRTYRQTCLMNNNTAAS